MQRREFLQSAGLIAAGAAVPTILPSRVFGRQAPSERITLAFIGTGRQAQTMNIPEFMAVPGVQVVAVCDVDSWRLDRAKTLVESTYATKAPSGTYKGCATYRDFREVLARTDVDAVMISTPDHWHVPMALMALRAGKDVSLEKPITRYIAEGRQLVNEVATHKRVFRVDSEFRSLERFHRAVELVRNGHLGTLRTIRVASPKEEFPQEAAVEAPVPAELDYDLWLGPAPKVPYMQKRVHNPRDIKGRPGWFRSTMYADGMLTNWGAHLVDICQWANGTERTGPIEVQATGKYHDDPVWDVLETFDARYRFANGVEMFYTMDQPHIRFEGDKGWLQVNYSKSAAHPEFLEASRPSILAVQLGADALRFPLRSERVDFIDAVKRRGQTMEDAEIGQRTISICHLAHIGVKRQGKALTWDPAAERFTNDDEANRHLQAPAGRGDWGTK
ncbi:Gfo/Idh/MocA family oxidoreductase [Luteitalea sp.]|uniref:Gfo/Idh/MocA family protein n=1 Tax=Luteitalea sp. TaxID=2004800 RepID=UPI0025B83E75|nr:Gfo/Idh/MocA family oxidoreductase [Luteitalea sp.]